MTNWNEIAKQIEIAISELALSASRPHGLPEWTEAIKDTARKIGIREHYEVAPDPQKYNQQWLYDLVWYKESEIGTTSVPLVLESEWSMDFYQVRIDFEKLLVAKSQLKIMIFQQHVAEMTDWFQKLTKCVEAFSPIMDDEIYLLLCYNLTSDRFIAHYIKPKRAP